MPSAKEDTLKAQELPSLGLAPETIRDLSCNQVLSGSVSHEGIIILQVSKPERIYFLSLTPKITPSFDPESFA